MPQSFLRIRFHIDFRISQGGPKWNRFVAQGIQLPTWSFETEEQGRLVFYRALERTDAGNASARLFIDRMGPATPDRASVEVAIRGNWKDRDEKEPPLPAVSHMVAEAEALMVLLGVRNPKARFEEAQITKR